MRSRIGFWSRATAVVAAALVGGSWCASAGIALADPPPPPPQPKTTIDHDGTFAVGTDIVPGTYSSAGPVGGGTCYWKRLGGDNGSDTLDNAMTKKSQIVQIASSDKAFKTDGCQPWQMTNTPAPVGIPPGIGGAQLGAWMAIINGRSGQYDGSQLPPP